MILESKEEAQVLLNILDIAVKAGGLQVAGAAMHFASKIETFTKELDKAPAAQETDKE